MCVVNLVENDGLVLFSALSTDKYFVKHTLISSGDPNTDIATKL